MTPYVPCAAVLYVPFSNLLLVLVRSLIADSSPALADVGTGDSVSFALSGQSCSLHENAPLRGANRYVCSDDIDFFFTLD